MTSYSIAENPFSFGLQQISYEDTFKNFQVSKKAEGAFYAGRTIRFGVNIAGAVADLALQLFQILTSALTLLLIKSESKLKKCEADHTTTMYLRIVPITIGKIRDYATKNQPSNLAIDIEIIAQYLKIQDFPKKFDDYISEKLFS